MTSQLNHCKTKKEDKTNIMEESVC